MSRGLTQLMPLQRPSVTPGEACCGCRWSPVQSEEDSRAGFVRLGLRAKGGGLHGEDGALERGWEGATSDGLADLPPRGPSRPATFAGRLQVRMPLPLCVMLSAPGRIIMYECAQLYRVVDDAIEG
jgi:hypothetical protein